MRFRKREGIWHVRLTIDGKRYERTTGCADRKAAEARARELERDIADPESASRKARLATTLEAVISLASFREKKLVALKKAKEVTHAFHVKKWGQVLRVLGGETRACDITVSTMAAYIEKRRSEGMSDNTITKEISCLKVALQVARDENLWDGNLDALTPTGFGTDYTPKERALTVPEVRRLVGALTAKRAAWVGLMVGAGAEYSAACDARRSDRDRKAGLTRVRGTKNAARDRVVPEVLPECKALLDMAWACGGGKGDSLLGSWGKIWRDLQAACKRAGIEPCSAHDLRRTFAHWHLAAGVPFEDVARAMGHASTAMLYRVYGKLPPAALRERMLEGLAKSGAPSTAPRVPRKSVDGAEESHKEEGPPPQDLPEGEGLDGCRRWDLNLRPWDYDSKGRRITTPLFEPWIGDGRSRRRDTSAPRVPHESDSPVPSLESPRQTSRSA